MPHRPELRELSIVVPLCNEEDNIPELYARLTKAVADLVESYELVFVNDGSTDQTPELIDRLAADDKNVKPIHLSRNFGHQPAITAGMSRSRGKMTVLMDGDLQDPPESLGLFVEAWRQGYEVVYAIREKRKEGMVKRTCYFLFYRFLRLVSDLTIPLDSGDFCLMDRKVVEAMNQLPERLRFVRGLRTFVGFKQVGIKYERHARAAGAPKYSFRKLVALAIDGIVSFSSYPLRMAIYFGFATSFFSLILTAWVFFDAFYGGETPRGWASTMVVVLVIGSMQLFCTGILGEYVRRVFLESKRRPTYIIRDDDAATETGGED